MCHGPLVLLARCSSMYDRLADVQTELAGVGIRAYNADAYERGHGHRDEMRYGIATCDANAKNEGRKLDSSATMDMGEMCLAMRWRGKQTVPGWRCIAT